MAQSSDVPSPPVLPVEIISHASIWTWLAPPLISFAASVVLFSGTLYTLYRTNRANDERLDRQLQAARTEKVDERVDQFRDEVAGILAERQTLKVAQAGAGFATRLHRNDPEDVEQYTKFIDSRQERLPQFNQFEQLVIRASLFTNDADAITVLERLRGLAEQSKALFVTPEDKDPQDEASELMTQVDVTFKELETLTRKLSTALPEVAPSQTIAQAKPREHWWQFWRPRHG